MQQPAINIRVTRARSLYYARANAFAQRYAEAIHGLRYTNAQAFNASFECGMRLFLRDNPQAH